MISAGRVLLMPKGDYDSNTTYEMLDIVSYNGSSYIAKGTTTGNLPTNTTYWQLSAYGGQTANLAGNFAPLETTAYASRAYATDDIFVDKDSQLVIATDAINIGDEIEIGSNCEITSIADLLDAIKNHYDALDQRNRKLIGITQLTAQTDLHLLVPGEYYKKLTNFYVTNGPTGVNQVPTAVFRLTVESGLDESSSSILLTLRASNGKVYTQSYDGTSWSAWVEVASKAYVDSEIASLGTASTKDSTNAVTSGSTDLIESGAVYTGLDGKYDKTGGTLSGDVVVSKTATTGRSAVITEQFISSTGNNIAEIYADSEGGNLRLTKGGDTAHLELDTANMNGSSGYARLYLGKSGSEAIKFFKFTEDGSFEDGNGIGSWMTVPFMPIYGTTRGQGALADAFAVDTSNVYGDMNRVGYVYAGYTANIPEDCNTGIREVFYYNSTNMSIKISGRDTSGLYGEWGSNWDGTYWSGWQRLNSKVSYFYGAPSNTSVFNSNKSGAEISYIYDKDAVGKRVCSISVINTYDTFLLMGIDGLFSIFLENGNPKVFDATGTDVTATTFISKGYEITATDAFNYVLKIPTARRVWLFTSQASIQLN